MFGAVAEGLLIWFLCWALYGGVSMVVGDNGLYALGEPSLLDWHHVDKLEAQRELPYPAWS